MNLPATRGTTILDDILLKAAADGRSGQEMERISGIPAAQAVQHVKELLNSRNVWDEHQQRQLLNRTHSRPHPTIAAIPAKYSSVPIAMPDTLECRTLPHWSQAAKQPEDLL